jgi:hypothetical protein
MKEVFCLIGTDKNEIDALRLTYRKWVNMRNDLFL